MEGAGGRVRRSQRPLPSPSSPRPSIRKPSLGSRLQRTLSMALSPSRPLQLVFSASRSSARPFSVALFVDLSSSLFSTPSQSRPLPPPLQLPLQLAVSASPSSSSSPASTSASPSSALQRPPQRSTSSSSSSHLEDGEEGRSLEEVCAEDGGARRHRRREHNARPRRITHKRPRRAVIPHHLHSRSAKCLTLDPGFVERVTVAVEAREKVKGLG